MDFGLVGLEVQLQLQLMAIGTRCESYSSAVRSPQRVALRPVEQASALGLSVRGRFLLFRGHGATFPASLDRRAFWPRLLREVSVPRVKLNVNQLGLQAVPDSTGDWLIHGENFPFK